jgi:carnitine O-acetyltransferase
MSPDAFVQCVIQVATTRLFGKSVGTYEASQVRVFTHGRTETTRSCSLETVELCQAMGSRDDGGWMRGDEGARRMGLLRKAAEGHVGYLKKAAKGEGVDRHMFGLKVSSVEDGEGGGVRDCSNLTQSHNTKQMLLKSRERVPALFNNPLFAASKNWRVSTSHLTHPSFDNWGWGEVVPDGVGIAYSIHKDRCVFNVTARRETGYSRRCAQLIEDALVEVWGMIMRERQGGSKL